MSCPRRIVRRLLRAGANSLTSKAACLGLPSPCPSSDSSIAAASFYSALPDNRGPSMCDECEFWSGCSVRDAACREILLSEDLSNMRTRVLDRLIDCTLFLVRDSRRYA